MAGEGEALRRQLPGVVAQVVVHEALDEVVAVVVARVAAQRERLAHGRAGGLEQVRVQLLGQEFVGQALVDEDARGVGCGGLAVSYNFV